MGQLFQYEIIGRKLPSAQDPKPKLYKMTIFAPNEVVAKSRFWYFLPQLKKMKKTTGQIVNIQNIRTDVVASSDIKREHIKQFLNPDIKFPLPHRRIASQFKSRFVAKRPTTFFG